MIHNVSVSKAACLAVTLAKPRKSLGLLAIASSAIIGGVLGATPIHAAGIIYQDNFQSATNGSTIVDAPVSWVGNPAAGYYGDGAFLMSNSTPFGPALAVTRDESNGGIAQTPISGISSTAGSGDIILTAQIFVPGAPNDSYVGLNKSSVGTFNNSGIFIGVSQNSQFAIDFRGIAGQNDANNFVFSVAESTPLLGQIITATADMNVDTNTLKVFFTNGATTLTFTTSGGLDFSGFDKINIDYTLHDSQLAYIDIGSLQVSQTHLPAIAGDINNDGHVDLDDYGLLTSHWLQTVQAGANGDLNLDGKVSLADFKMFKADYQLQNPSASPLAAPVPEPCGIILAVTALPLLGIRLLRRRFRHSD